VKSTLIVLEPSIIYGGGQVCINLRAGRRIVSSENNMVGVSTGESNKQGQQCSSSDTTPFVTSTVFPRFKALARRENDGVWQERTMEHGKRGQ